MTYKVILFRAVQNMKPAVIFCNPLHAVQYSMINFQDYALTLCADDPVQILENYNYLEQGTQIPP